MHQYNRFSILIGLLSLFLTTCKVEHLANIEPSVYQIEPSMGSGSEDIQAMIAPYKVQLDSEMNQVIGIVGMELTKTMPESTLGNWLVDLLQEETSKVSDQPIDFTLQNYGGIRISSIPKGPINRGKIFELMPFDNMAVVVELDANHTRKLIHLMAADGGWPVSKGLSYQIKDGKAEHIKIHGQPIEEGRIYWVSMPDYIANGGGNAEFLKDKNRIQTGHLIRDLIIQHIQNEQDVPQMAEVEGRVR